jgi:hypothetical protein
MRIGELLGSGRAWATLWLSVAGLHALLFWPSQTVWSHSIRFLNFISVDALVLGCLAAFQSSLGMRKADPEDPL